jgi:hypothetical protein
MDGVFMKAYELADTLNECIDDGSTDLYCVCHAAKMLRQQADRIAELEKELLRYSGSLGVERARVHKLEKYIVDAQISPQIKELSDEEIVRISKTCDLNHVLGLIDFARAILKKASEK